MDTDMDKYMDMDTDMDMGMDINMDMEHRERHKWWLLSNFIIIFSIRPIIKIIFMPPIGMLLDY